MGTNKDDTITLMGQVIDSNKGVFRVQVSDNHIVHCKLSGKMKLNDIKVIINDTVELEVSAYNLMLGRITKRFKQQ